MCGGKKSRLKIRFEFHISVVKHFKKLKKNHWSKSKNQFHISVKAKFLKMTTCDNSEVRTGNVKQNSQTVSGDLS